MGRKSDYSDDFKLEVVEYAERTNVAEASRHFDVHRHSVTKWVKDREEIRKSIAVATTAQAITKLSDKDLKEIKDVRQQLLSIGNLEERKAIVGAQVEKLLIVVVNMLEAHPNLAEIHPKDLSKIMIDLNTIKKDLYNEPTVVVEYRAGWMERVVMVLSELVSKETLSEFINKMEVAEAKYDEIS